MRKLTTTMKTLMLLAAFIWPALSVSGQVIISQYIETNSGTSPKGIELWNTSASTIDFSVTNLDIEKGTNGGTPSSDYLITTGTLAAGEVIVVGTSDLSPDYEYGFSFNGDDALVIKLDGTIVDVVGTPESDPGSAWEGNGVSTANQNIQLLTGITTGDTDGWTDPSARFETVSTDPVNDQTGFGVAPETGGPADPEPTNHVADFTATADDAANVTLTWTDNDGTQPADAFLIKANTGAITAPADGTEEADDTDLSDGAGAINVAHGVGTYTFSNLDGATTYNFEIYPYTNSGADIDFKTDGTVPSTSATTLDGTIGWANLQWPDAGTIAYGDEYIVYGRVYVAGITDAVGEGAGIDAWVGYSTEDTDPSTWTNWVPASYANDVNSDSDDEYTADLGAEVPVGNYYYATRFQLNGGDYYYGGYNAGGGNFWDGTDNVSGTLTVTPPVTALPYARDFESGDLGTDGWSTQVVVGTMDWEIASYEGDTYAEMSNFDGSTNNASETWLISPAFDLSGANNPVFGFYNASNWSGADMEVYVSTDYDGLSAPSTATWTPLSPTLSTGGYDDVYSGDLNLSAYIGGNAYIAFKYTGSDSDGKTWQVDDITVEETPIGEPPVVQNIATNPDAPTSSDAVSVAADVTDADGTITSVTLNYGTTAGTLDQSINMSVSTAPTYVTDTDIPAMADGTTVYYEVVVEDNDANMVSSSEMMYEVTDPASTTIPYTETFDADLGDMYTYSVLGDTKTWYHNSGAANINGYDSGETEEDWMIFPAVDLSAKANEVLTFDSWFQYGSEDANNYFKLMYSTDYTGVGDPSSATWTELTFTAPSDWDTWTPSGVVDLNAINDATVYFAFKYHYEAGSYRSWSIDNIVIEQMISPIISNIIATPDAPSSSDPVSVSADVTDSDGTIDSVALVWGTATGDYNDTINMGLSTGDTYVTDSDIPAQADGTTVYYQVVAIDNDMQETATAEMMYDVYDPVVVTLPYSNDFETDLGDVTTYSVIGDQTWVWDEYSGDTFAKMSGYSGGDQENEDWLITPAIDMTAPSTVKMVFTEAINHADVDVNVNHKVFVSTDYSGVGNPNNANWTEITVTGRADGGNWDFVTVNEIDLNAYAGESSVHVGFKYTSTTSEAATWEISNILIEEGQALVAPVFENITLTPEQPTSSDAVSVSATITDGNGTIDTATLHWGTNALYGNTINMSVSSGDTYVTDSNIPAQEDGTMIFYKIVATDNEANESSSDDLAYWAFDPYAGTLPFFEPFYYDLSVMEAVSATGDQTWNHDSYGYAKMSGFVYPDAFENEDWLITPSLDLSNVEGAVFVYDEAINFGGTIDDEQEVMISTDYDGAGDPATATWTELTITNRPAGNSWDFVTVDEVDLADYVGEASVHIAFVYTSTTSNAATWEVDNISVTGADGIIFSTSQDLTVYPNPAQNTLFVNGINGDAQVDIISMDGKVVMNKQIDSNRVDVASLNEGLYIIRVTNNNEVYTTRFVKE